MIEAAAAECDRLVVFVNSSPARDKAPGQLRAGWLAELHPTVQVIEVRHSLATDFDYPDLWDKWMALFRGALAPRRRPARRLLVRRVRERTG